MSDEGRSVGDGIAAAGQAIAIAIVFKYVMGWYWTFCSWFVPADEDGEKSGALTLIVMISLTFFIYAGFMIFGSGRSHPSSYYTPQQYREFVFTKCFIGNASRPTSLDGVADSLAFRCLSLDEGTIPEMFQGKVLQYNSDFTLGGTVPAAGGMALDTNGTVSTVKFASNNPNKFEHPTLYWSDGTTPGVSVLRFWNWSMLK